MQMQLDCYTISEAALALDVTPQTVRNCLEDGRLESMWTAGGEKQLVTMASVEALKVKRDDDSEARKGVAQ